MLRLLGARALPENAIAALPATLLESLRTRLKRFAK
jgi:hypothetical protein